ncbi:hypothetical protein ADT67_00440 [Levilactobacillus brevis]|uniref:Transcriptional regulator2C TetR family n=1 Tax=Levilactobacillus brevis TaxID=1580 RepID=A0A5B7XW77_LEVBR|nr:TetR/AcrR family transcriptional regulator [Levilactobacillus brevis]AJA81229.1 hypothetical protein L747_10835 [Levilactobacillus brevis BSO 464]KIO94415.1 Transcriptional regulator, TetR family [Levilactobacillus brevis]KIO96983.1 Transcriptional regulator, TetR family [Levilactobacillus brevis]OLF68810.1 hypothetical protein ADT67_00440 [Levilactobacillus brevis]QCZ52124.1 Transcriptional regulator2C TetR family [Levilactobacillus brevis]
MATENERRQQMIRRITQTIVQNGFADLKMEKIAKLMGVSRTKMYQYYSCKTAIMTDVVARYLEFMATRSVPQSVDAKTSVTNFPQVILNLANLIASSSQKFRRDLAQADEELSEQFEESYASWCHQVRDFLTNGVTNGAFNSSLQPELFLIQMEATVAALMQPRVLTQHKVVTQNVLREYLQMVITQVVAPKYRAQINLDAVEPDLEHLTLKYQQTLTK